MVDHLMISLALLLGPRFLSAVLDEADTEVDLPSAVLLRSFSLVTTLRSTGEFISWIEGFRQLDHSTLYKFPYRPTMMMDGAEGVWG